MIVAADGPRPPAAGRECICTARITAAQNTRNWAFSCGLSPGSSRLPTPEPPSDQLTCLPEPLMPANGFSCSRQAMPYFCATRCRVMHDHLLMIGGHVGVFVDRGDFVLGRSDFVVPRLDRHAQLEQLALGFQHAGQHALGNRAEVVVFEFLALGRLGAVQRAAGGDQVGPGEVEVAVDQEVFLLGAGRGRDRAGVLVAEQLQNPLGLLVQRLHRTQQRRLLVQRLAGPGDRTPSECRASCRWGFPECRPGWSDPRPCSRGLRTWRGCRPRESSKRRARPGSAPCRENSASAVPSPVGRQEAVVLFGRQAGQRVEDVGVVGGPFSMAQSFMAKATASATLGSSFSPFLIVCCKGLVDRLRQPILHDLSLKTFEREQLAAWGLFEIQGLSIRFVVGHRRNRLLTCTTQGLTPVRTKYGMRAMAHGLLANCMPGGERTP